MNGDKITFEATFADTVDHFYGDFSVSDVIPADVEKTLTEKFDYKRVRVTLELLGEVEE